MNSRQVLILATVGIAIVACIFLIPLANATKVFEPLAINQERNIGSLNITLTTAQAIVSNKPTLRLTFAVSNNSIAPVDISSDTITVFIDDKEQQSIDPTVVTMAFPNETVDIVKTVSYQKGCTQVIVLFNETKTDTSAPASWIIKCSDLES